jgi:AcrR family transcriptional regulator
MTHIVRGLPGGMGAVVGARAAQKLQTRQALLDAALRLMADRNLSALSLREVSREAGIVPAGFYRHFPDLDSLGAALVEQSLGGLRTTLRAVRAGVTDSDEIARRSIDVLAREVRGQRAQFRFIARERHGGVARVREAIREQLRLIGEELATDLLTRNATATAVLGTWDRRDVAMFTDLVVNHMVSTAAAILDAPAGQPGAERRVITLARKQLRLIVLGARHWTEG